MREDTRRALVLNATGARAELHDPVHLPPPPTHSMPRLLILLLLKLFTRVGAAFATKITQSLRDWFVNWSNGVVRDAETVLDAMANRAIQQVAAALRQRRQGRGADGRHQVYASSRVLLLFARALFFSFAARCLKIMGAQD